MKFLCILLIFVSCQSRKIKNEISTIPIDTVENNRIHITKESAYGPSPLDNKYIEGLSGEETKVFALRLIPQLYNSYLYIPYLKKLKKAGQDVHVISGYGFTSVIASLYANSVNLNEFEWKVFRLYKKLEKEEAFSRSWQNIIKESLEKEFKNKKPYELKRLLLIPFKEGNKVVYKIDRPVKELVMKSLTDRTKENYFISPTNIHKAFKEASSCDYCIGLAVIPKMLKFKREAGDKLQIYSKILGHVSLNVDNYIEINKVDSYLDWPSGLEIFYHKYDKSIENAVEETLQKISTK